MKFIFKHILGNLIILILPFLILALTEEDKNYWDILLGRVVYLMMLGSSIFYMLAFQIDNILNYLKKKDSIFEFVGGLLLFIISFSLLYSSYYYCTYLEDPSRFANVIKGNFFETYFDFFYYSFGKFLLNNNSQIIATSNFSKLISLTEILASFTSIVIILANYKDLKITLKHNDPI